MPLLATRGGGSVQGFGRHSAAAPNYIEDVFSTYLYTGNGSTQTITNGIDLAGKGGLVWIKDRPNPNPHYLFDTSRTANNYLSTNNTNANLNDASDTLTSFDSTGFSLGANSTSTRINRPATNYVSWTFRKQAKFFDVVTYTGNGSSGGLNISHNLGSQPGCIFIKRTDASGNWIVRHRSLANSGRHALWLNSTNASVDMYGNYSTDVTSTIFKVVSTTSGGYPDWDINVNGATYVAYLFAHDAGGFGQSGSDNVISCGSYTTDVIGSATVNLGWEPQFVIHKKSSTGGGVWFMQDTMRGWSMGNDNYLAAEQSAAEVSYQMGDPTATGFTMAAGDSTSTYIYIAIRRGPMKTPTTGTSVYGAYAKPLSETINSINPGFTSDLMIAKNRSGGTASGAYWFDRLRGMANPSPYIISSNTGAEGTQAGKQYGQSAASNNVVSVGPGANTNLEYDDPSNESVFWFLRRAPGFFDVVCYTGTSSVPQAFNHNLGVAPELVIVKYRTDGINSNYLSTRWVTYHKDLGFNTGLELNTSAAPSPSNNVLSAVSSSTFTVRNADGAWNNSTWQYVAYLFATVAGVSKVFSYTGNGSSQTINCGFTGGARFVLIKRTDSTGDWYVWDSARGIIAANDPHLSLNSTAAEVTGNDSIDPDNSGFIVNQNATTNINVTSATYIYLAIA